MATAKYQLTSTECCKFHVHLYLVIIHNYQGEKTDFILQIQIQSGLSTFLGSDLL
jgi:hypothetical protein